MEMVKISQMEMVKVMKLEPGKELLRTLSKPRCDSRPDMPPSISPALQPCVCALVIE